MYFGSSGGRRMALGAGGVPIVASEGPKPGTYFATNAAGSIVTQTDFPKLQDGTCTSDGRLIWTLGRWQVVSDDTEGAKSCKFTINYSAQDIIGLGYGIYVGPLLLTIGQYQTLTQQASDAALGTLSVVGGAGLPPSSSGGKYPVGTQITEFNNPVQLSAAWRGWFDQAFKNALKNGLPTTLQSPGAEDVPAKCPTGQTPYYNPNATYDSIYLDSTTMLPGSIHCCPDGSWTCGPAPATLADGSVNAKGIAPCNCTSDPGCWKAYLSDNAAKAVSSLGASTDLNGLPCQLVTYEGDPNTYTWYSPCDWINAIGPGDASTPGVSNFVYWLPVGQTINDLVDRLFNYSEQPGWNLAPAAKFRHPITGDTWGVWLVLMQQGDTSTAPGQWSTLLGGPAGFSLQIGLGPIPSEPWYDYLFDALMWIPAALGEIASFVVGGLLDIICSNPTAVAQGATAAAASSKGNAAVAASAAAVGLATKLCPAPPTPVLDCTNPMYATTSLCQPAVATPWYQQWYVILGAIFLVGIGIISSSKHEKSSTPSTSTQEGTTT